LAVFVGEDEKGTTSRVGFYGIFSTLWFFGEGIFVFIDV
jgi:hypothetical protein